MFNRGVKWVLALAAAVTVTAGGVQAADDAKYPNLEGPVGRHQSASSAAR